MKRQAFSWSLAEVRKAIPYVRLLLLSIRESYLDKRIAERRIHIIKNRPGKVTKTQLLDLQELTRQVISSETRLHEAIEELEELGVFCHDVIRAVGVFYFVHHNEPAHFVYSPMGEELFWRVEGDSLECKREVAFLEE